MILFLCKCLCKCYVFPMEGKITQKKRSVHCLEIKSLSISVIETRIDINKWYSISNQPKNRIVLLRMRFYIKKEIINSIIFKEKYFM